MKGDLGNDFTVRNIKFIFGNTALMVVHQVSQEQKREANQGAVSTINKDDFKYDYKWKKVDIKE